MKKKMRLLTALLLALLTVALSFSALLPATADDGEPTPLPSTFESTFFPHGISAPPTPYLESVDNEAGSESNGKLDLWYTAPIEIRNACIAYRDTLDDEGGEYCFDAFREQYAIGDWWFYSQVDISVDGGAWMHTEEWDRAEYAFPSWVLPAQLGTGEQCANGNVGLVSERVLWAEDAAGEECPYRGIVVPYVNGYDETVYHLDLDNHTVAIRMRYVAEYDVLDNYGGFYEKQYVLGAWSPVVSIGKNGTQTEPTKPTTMPVPAIADFNIVEPEDGMGDPHLTWSINNEFDYNAAQLYLKMNMDTLGWVDVELQGEMRVNLGEWVPIPTWDTGIAFGAHASYDTDQLHPGCHVDARFRAGCDELGWSAWTPVFSAGAEMYCNHPTFGTWHPCADDDELCERICTVCGFADTKYHYDHHDPVILKQPTCTVEGTRQYTCTDCGFKWTQAIPTNDAHVYGAWVKQDADTCTSTCTLCKTATETQGHYFIKDLSRSTAATCGHDGTDVYVCSDCHFEKTETLPKLTTHRFNLPGNENSYWHTVGLDKPHERICPDCGHKETAPHAYDGGYVTKKATCAEEGIKTFTCECGQTYTQPIAKTTNHNYSTKWKTDTSGHWHECSVCHDRKDFAFHTPGPEPTEDSAQLCTVCGYVIKPKLEHTHKVTTGWTYDEKGHWHYCTGCGEKSAYAAHTFANDCDTTCDICGFVRTVTHTPGTAWAADGTGHWHVCDKCGIPLTVTAHTPGPAATESQPQTCTVCGYILHPVLDHVHVWNDTYAHDGTHHWVTCRGCTEIKAKETHTYDGDCDPTCNVCAATREVFHVITNKWEADAEGHWCPCLACGAKEMYEKHHFENACDPFCNVCGYIRDVQHSFETTWKGDDQAHWHACSVCGEKTDTAAHVFDNEYDPTCNTCGYTRTVQHRYSEEWKYDDTHHWHVCSDCDAQSDKAEHIFDNACDTVCNVCGYTRTITHTLPAVWTTDDDDHWHVCSICQAICDKAAHTPGEPATVEHDQVCTVCGHVIAPKLVTQDTVPETDTVPEPGTTTEPATGTATDTEPETGTPIDTVGELQTYPETDTDADSETETDTGKVDPTDKCWLCGFCPCPLGLCIFIWLLILLIVIVLIILLIPKKKKCPECGTKVDRKDKVCPKCGKQLRK